MSYFETRARSVLLRVLRGKTLSEISAEKGQPRLSTMQRWFIDQPEFVRAYLSARRIAAEEMAAEIVSLAEALKPDSSPTELSRQKLRIDARKWAIQRMAQDDAGLDDGSPAVAPQPPVFV